MFLAACKYPVKCVYFYSPWKTKFLMLGNSDEQAFCKNSVNLNKFTKLVIQVPMLFTVALEN